jgi:hypothetical protein
MNSRPWLRSHFFSLLFAVIVSKSPAQQNAEVTLQFVSFPKTDEVESVELLIGDGKTEKVEIPFTSLGAPLKVPRLTTWAVGKSLPGGNGVPPSFKVFGQAPALAAPKQLLLLVRKGQKNEDGFDVLPIDNDVGNFGGGKFLFMNLAKVDIAGEVGGQKFAVKPGGNTIVKPHPEPNGRMFHATFYFRHNEEPKPFFTSKWPANPMARSLVFFFHDPVSKQLSMHSIRDIVPE